MYTAPDPTQLNWSLELSRIRRYESIVRDRNGEEQTKNSKETTKTFSLRKKE